MLNSKNILPGILSKYLYGALVFILGMITLNVFGQAPVISYQTPQVYKVNTAITALSPTNTGGAILGNYGQVSTYVINTFSNTGSILIYPAGVILVTQQLTNQIQRVNSVPSQFVNNFANSAMVKGSANGPASTSTFYLPTGICVDGNGNYYVTDRGNSLIRKISPGSIVSTIAGSGAKGAADGTGAAASFNDPFGIITDAAGNVYIADRGNHVIRMMTPAGVVSTLAGSGVAGAADGTGTSASFNDPTGLTIDAAGNLYVTDPSNQAIRKVTPAGVVTTLAGGTKGSANGTGAAAQFDLPTGITIDAAGNLYVADQNNNQVRMVTPAGVVSFIAGNTSSAFGTTDGTGSAASFANPVSIAFDGQGNLFVAEQHSIRKVSIAGYVIDKPLPSGLSFNPGTGIISGTPTVTSPATNYTITAYNGSGSSSFVVNIEIDNAPIAPPNISYQTPNVYVTNTTISPLAPANTGGAVPATIYGLVSTIAGSGATGAVNGSGTLASFRQPYGLVVDPSYNIFVADCNNELIRKITNNNTVSILAGSGIIGATNGTGTGASFNAPGGVSVDPLGNIYVGDQNNNLIRKITPAGVVTTYAGSGAQGATDGIATSASFYGPAGSVFDASGNLYVADRNNSVIRMIRPGGLVSTFAGSGTMALIDGVGTAASFNQCSGLAIDMAGNFYITDQYNNSIRKISPSATVTTLAGNGSQGATNGVGALANFNRPFGLAVDAAGVVYVADEFNHLIRKITPAGVVTTMAGTGVAGAVDGIGTLASFNYPSGIALDGLGNGFITEVTNEKVRKIILTGYTIDKALPTGLVFDPTTGIITGTPIVTWPPTDYTVTAYNAGGSSSTIVNIEVVASIVFNPIASKTICDVDFDPGATSLSPITYTSSNVAVATIVTGKVHIVGAGTTIITAANGFTTLSQTLTVIAPANPTISIAANNTSICVGMPVTYTATITSGGNNPVYQWQVNGVNVGTNSPGYTTTTTASTDVVQCTVANNDICPVSSTSNNVTGITVNPYITPAVSIVSSVNVPVCSGTSITFTATPTNGGLNPAYQWQVNGINSGTNSPIFIGNTFANGDKVTCILTNQGGACLTAASATSNAIVVNIIPDPNPLPAVIISATAVSAYIGTAITFTAITANVAGSVVSYQWFVNSTAVGTNNPVFTSSSLNNGDVVTCKITAVFACSITVTSQLVTIKILPAPPITIPNTFTPNGDGINDNWTIGNISFYPNCLVSIFNRYGTLIYQSRGYSVNWDGTYNGKPVPEATYEYIIDLGNNSPKQGGSVSVVR